MRDLPGVRVLNSDDPRDSCGIGALSVDGVDAAELTTRLRAGLSDSRWPRVVEGELNCIRVTPNVFTTLEEVDFFAEAIETIVRKAQGMSWATYLGIAALFLGPEVTGRRGMVTSNHPLASAAGFRILLGGNAFDAAVATAAATSVVDPSDSSLGGNGFATIYVAKSREVKTLNFFGTAPSASKPALFTHETLNQGILSSPVPSNLEGYRVLLEAHGTMSLARVVEPAIELAEEGFLVTETFRDEIAASRELFARYPTTAAVFLPNGSPPDVGTIFRQPDYARTLRQVAERGARDFYEGELARRVASFFAEEGGILTEEDLADYQAKWVEPISISYRGFTIVTQPPNSSAVALLEELNIMEGYDSKALGHNTAPYLHRFMESVRLALANRNQYVADTDAVPVPLEALLSKGYARAQRARIEPDRAVAALSPGRSYERARWRYDASDRDGRRGQRGRSDANAGCELRVEARRRGHRTFLQQSNAPYAPRVREPVARPPSRRCTRR